MPSAEGPELLDSNGKLMLKSERAVGAPRALISEGLGITRHRGIIADSYEKGAVGG